MTPSLLCNAEEWDDCCSALQAHKQVSSSNIPEITENGFFRSQLSNWRLMKLHALPLPA
jgi:hypothetical protein